MAEVYKFFNSAPGDLREYYASDFADYFGSVLSTGLLHIDGNPGLRATVVPGTLTTKVSSGKAIMKGYAYENTSDLILEHDIPETTLKRIDRIVLRLDLANASRYVKLFIKKGASASAPVAPDLQRDQYIYELSLAQVLVRENTTQLLETDLKDERYYEDLCGFVTSLITVPTERFQEEWDTWFKSVQEEGFAPYRDTGYKENLKTIDKTSIVAGVNELKEDYVRSPGYATATGTNAYAVTLNPAPTSYKEGMGVVIKITNASTGAATINVNGLGAKPILKANGLAVSDLKAGAVYTLRYSGTAFILQGEGGNEKEIVSNTVNLITAQRFITYMDDDYIYAVDGAYAYKILKSTGTIVKTIAKKSRDITFYAPGYVTEAYIGHSSSEISYVYDENGTLLKSWNVGYYYQLVGCCGGYYYIFVDQSTNYRPFIRCNLSDTQLNTIFIDRSNNSYMSTERTKMSIKGNTAYVINSYPSTNSHSLCYKKILDLTSNINSGSFSINSYSDYSLQIANNGLAMTL